MHRISTGLSAIALMAALGCLSLPRGIQASATQIAGHKPNFADSGIDPMPVGTAREMARTKRARFERHP